jgi:hypothetical protein
MHHHRRGALALTHLDLNFSKLGAEGVGSLGKVVVLVKGELFPANRDVLDDLLCLRHEVSTSRAFHVGDKGVVKSEGRVQYIGLGQVSAVAFQVMLRYLYT